MCCNYYYQGVSDENGVKQGIGFAAQRHDACSTGAGVTGELAHR